ncbi:NADH-quinone oxidoreductase subunit A [Aeromicrobium chenweiae]|uniref:NADH-quinone oxidoreductase subunit A n=1 Tax=Aeromicrobium chenweiae TaxID=2079793 RepID=A0A2S0WQ73_9ACTN|nr:NADH-quinone oxidoreductase subunit A [Aeromicrobium chenweiae]AWB93505.1 NADH-quinone oxidoreductase subunit A [Aeromicrobium chenweiae]TGN34498.1 NADH-quinone oxidoreductase subunit A [Aeromicrobium chenweiae]
MRAYLDDYAAVGVIILVGIVLATAMLGVNRLLRPRVAQRDKTMTYESGVDPVGEGWSQSTVRYYVYAFLYVIFAVDAVFLFPWAVVLEDIGRAAAAEMAIFVGILVVGLAYAWRKGVLSWTP